MDDYAIPDEITDSLQTPFLVVYLDKVRENLARMLVAMSHDHGRWRPHLKTTKLPIVWSEMLTLGLRSFKCATTREAGCLLACARTAGVEDIDLLVAYPLSGPGPDRLECLADEYPGACISMTCEDPLTVTRISSKLGIWVDLNGGMNRTGIPLAEIDRISEVCHLAGSRLRGLHFYEGQIIGGNPATRRTRCHESYAELLTVADKLRKDGIDTEHFITSGTPAFTHALSFPGFNPATHQVSPGTVIFHDARSEEDLPELDLVPAALLFSRVISHPAKNVITLDAGSKAISTDAGAPCAMAFGQADLTALIPSEEHLPMTCPRQTPPPRGELIPLFPKHICTTVNLADEAVIMDNGNFVGLIPIAARGHETMT